MALVGQIAALLTLTTALLFLAGAVRGSHQARLAADLAALAGAARLQGGAGSAQACAIAGAVARDNRGRLVGCSVGGATLQVLEVTVQVQPSRWPSPAIARARAGPAGS